MGERMYLHTSLRVWEIMLVRLAGIVYSVVFFKLNLENGTGLWSSYWYVNTIYVVVMVYVLVHFLLLNQIGKGSEYKELMATIRKQLKLGYFHGKDCENSGLENGLSITAFKLTGGSAYIVSNKGVQVRIHHYGSENRYYYVGGKRNIKDFKRVIGIVQEYEGGLSSEELRSYLERIQETGKDSRYDCVYEKNSVRINSVEDGLIEVSNEGTEDERKEANASAKRLMVHLKEELSKREGGIGK